MRVLKKDTLTALRKDGLADWQQVNGSKLWSVK
jgi:hypothetical protein